MATEINRRRETQRTADRDTGPRSGWQLLPVVDLFHDLMAWCLIGAGK